MRPLRNPVIQKAVSFTLSEWMRFCYKTTRWEFENLQLAEEVWEQGGGVLVAFWHSRLGLSVAAWPAGRAQEARGLISLSPDGEFLVKAMDRLGIKAVRGSSANKDKKQAAKGGTQALRDGLRQLKVGALAVTPDGPRGPAGVMAEGLPVMARMSGAPVLFLGISAKPCIQLNSWDKAVLPLPFAKGAIVWDRATYPEGAELADVVTEWTDRLNAVEARADAITGFKSR